MIRWLHQRWLNGRARCQARQRKIIAEAIWAYQECNEHFGRLDDAPEPGSMRALIRMTTIDQAELIRAELDKRGELCR